MRTRIGLLIGFLLILLILPTARVTMVDPVTVSSSSRQEAIKTDAPGEVDPSYNIDFQAAYHSAADRVIVFGGWNETPDYATGETWSYDLDTNTWTNMHPDVSPSPRFLCSMAYDSQSEKIVMFGGYEGQVPDFTFDETWVYDYATNNWTQASPSVHPSWRYGFQLAYDSESDVIIFFGGNEAGGRGFMNDTWAYDVDTDTWTEMSPAVSPSPRFDYTMEYDTLNDRMILFCGYDGSGLSDQWEYDYNTDTWTELTPSYRPSARSNPSMAYDNESQVMVLFAGNTGTEPLDDLWTYDYGMNLWTHYVNPENAPFVRHRHELVYDIQSDRIISIGGGLGPRLGASHGLVNDTLWSYDTNHNHWRQMSPSFPQGRGDPLITYDSDSDRVLIHGGWITTTIGDSWSYDFNTDNFYNLAPYPTAPTRQISAMEYDSQSHKTVMFSGLEMWPDGPYPDDTWIFDAAANNWTEVFPALSPSGRGGHRMAYDSESDRIIMYGGRAADGITFLDDTWSYDFETNTWTEMSPSTGPGARWYHSMTYDVESDRVILFGGLIFGPSGGALGDVWAYDYNTDTWEPLPATTSPAPRGTNSLSYDIESDRVVLFGGYDLVGDFDDTWIFDYNTNNWTQSLAHPHPSNRVRVESVYDSESDRVILYGGISYPYPSITDEDDFPIDPCWSYDVNTDTWTLMDINPGYIGEGKDSDLDELPDLTELAIGTDPKNPDSDSDLMPDGWEYNNNLNPLADDALEDPDLDDLDNIDEYLYGCDPHNSDSDSDSLPDGLEVHTYGTLPTKADSDDDLMPDAYEVANGLNAMANDTYDDLDSDGLSNYLEYQLGTSPQSADTDSDLASDSWEVLYDFDPLDSSDGAEDADSDRLLNYEEEAHGTNPRLADTDGDGYSDFWEIQHGFNPLDAHVPVTQLIVANIGLVILGVVGLVAFVVGYRYILFKEVRDLKRRLQDEIDEQRKAVQELAEDANNHKEPEKEL
ncbi:MAG: kelch repeat-containing protein [Candidatus Thorarchaeota archaeon]